uniref:Haloacid dehalogenase-like hydrolase (HAD) superfamily protein n=1 Tax=Oryza glumipatula TaxID=40148 RepID=A0A0D9ZUP8_9ORYZ
MESCSFRTAASPSPFPSLPSSSRQAPLCSSLRFPRPRNGRMVGVRRRASGFEAFPPLPGKVFVEEAIGAEYGEGFETFRMDGPLKVDVDYLNEKLQECFLQRIRHAMKPDEACGLIFSWDNILSGKDIPNAGHLQKSILHGAADHVLRKVLYWAKDESQMERLKARLIELYYENLFKLDTPVNGLREWLDAVQTAGIPCAVASSLDRRCMIEALDRMELSKYFKAIVTDEDDMESIAHRYELVQADLAIAKYSELSVINLRRLFAHKGLNFMDLQKQIIERSPPKRKLTVDTIF